MFLLDTVNELHPAIQTGDLLLGIWIAYRVVTGSWRFWHLAIGRDGRYSTSLFHGLVWTVVVVGSYLLLFLARIHAGGPVALGANPPNVLTALGLAVGTTVATAGITASRLARDPSHKSTAGPQDRMLAARVEEDDGRLSLAKAQLILWTLVSLFVSLVAVANATAQTLASSNPSITPTGLYAHHA